MDTLSVCGIAGSLRRESFNRSLLRAAVELAPAGMTITPFALDPVPLYNGDVEAAGDPPGVVALKEAIGGADALFICTPEYQHGVPGVLKNALDWAARPPGRSVLQGKPVAIVGATPGIVGTARAQTQLRQAFVFSQAWCVLQPEVLVGRVHEKIDAEGRLTDEPTRKYLGKLLVALWDLTRKLRQPAAG